MYKLCLSSAWGMGCGGWRQQHSPELLLDHFPVGGRRSSSMHCAKQAAMAQPAMGLWQQHSMRSGEGKVYSTEAEQMESGAQRSWMLVLHHPGLSSPRQGQDNHKHGTGARTTAEAEIPSVDASIFQGIGSASGCASGAHQSNTDLYPQQREGSTSSLWCSYSLRNQMPGLEKSVNTWP